MLFAPFSTEDDLRPGHYFHTLFFHLFPGDPGDLGVLHGHDLIHYLHHGHVRPHGLKKLANSMPMAPEPTTRDFFGISFGKASK